jgi:hypothetical protein
MNNYPIHQSEFFLFENFFTQNGIFTNKSVTLLTWRINLLNNPDQTFTFLVLGDFEITNERDEKLYSLTGGHTFRLSLDLHNPNLKMLEDCMHTTYKALETTFHKSRQGTDAETFKFPPMRSSEEIHARLHLEVIRQK